MAGIIRRGVLPDTIEYFEKSPTPSCSRRKSSSSTQRPFTSLDGALIIASIASENMVGFRSSALSVEEPWVAAESIACPMVRSVEGVAVG